MRACRTVPALLLVVAVLVGCSSSSGSDGASDEAESTAQATDETTTATEPEAEIETYEGDDDGFYEVPDPLPDGPHGTLIRSQRVPDADPEGGGVSTAKISPSPSRSKSWVCSRSQSARQSASRAWWS